MNSNKLHNTCEHSYKITIKGNPKKHINYTNDLKISSDVFFYSTNLKIFENLNFFINDVFYKIFQKFEKFIDFGFMKIKPFLTFAFF